MKLSLTWIFDHIDADWKSFSIKDIITKINSTTAEIENFTKLELNINEFELAQVIKVDDKITVKLVDSNKEIILFNRLDAKINDLFLIKKENNEFRWATLHDLGSSKEGLVPDLYISEKDLKNSNWKHQFEAEDYILELDNKSITNRPDLWGHRGFAREIAAIFNLPLKPISEFIELKPKIEVKLFEKNNEIPFDIKIENHDACKRFAMYYMPNITIKPSTLFMSMRLSKIDTRPINLIVDSTNYVMQDLSQPMHAFDANKIKSKIGPRFAKKDEKITLLDNETVKLTEHDLVIADAEKPVALAGIMGSINSEVDNRTNSLLIESASFDAGTVRKTSTSVKKRTDASSRFEKSLDPNQNIIALERFIKLLSLNDIKTDYSIVSLGETKPAKVIEISHDFIEKKLGTKIDSKFVIKTLEKMEFAVVVQQQEKNELKYIITVPSFRATKDITIPEDIVEEIGRFYGYDNIKFVLPAKQIKPFDLEETRRLRTIKQYLAFGAQMHEVQNYPFYDENFIKELNWQPRISTKVATPVSENWQRLVNSLIPHLLKNIQQNLLHPQKLNFFEVNNVWDTISESKSIEKKSLAGIFFDKKNPINFYDCKTSLNSLFHSLNLDIQWVKAKTENLSSWYSNYQTAELTYKDKVIGFAGMASKSFFSPISSSDAFIFEIDADLLLKEKAPKIKFKAISKYPSVWLDISLLVPLKVTVTQITNIIESSDSKIFKAELVDHFENPNWTDKKSLTMRYYLGDEHKTLSKDEIDEVMGKVIENIKKIDAQIR